MIVLEPLNMDEFVHRDGHFVRINEVNDIVEPIPIESVNEDGLFEMEIEIPIRQPSPLPSGSHEGNVTTANRTMVSCAVHRRFKSISVCVHQGKRLN